MDCRPGRSGPDAAAQRHRLNGQVLRLTRRSTQSANERVTGWPGPDASRTAPGQWLRWQSAGLTTRERAAGSPATGQPVGPEPRRRRKAARSRRHPLQDWQVFYYRADAWTNPLSSDASTATGATPTATVSAVIPDGVRVVLQLPAGQARRQDHPGLGATDGERRQVVSGDLMHRQRVQPLLAAMLTVTLVATLPLPPLWQQWRMWKSEMAERSQRAVGMGADRRHGLGTRLILREDARPVGPTTWQSPWPSCPGIRASSTFLAATDGAATVDTDGGDGQEAFLSGQIIDLQSHLNVMSLLEAGRVSDVGLRSFAKLFELLGLLSTELNWMAENLRFAADTSADNRSGGMAALMPQRVEQLTWLGLSPTTAMALRPYVTILPVATPVNLNTASPEVIAATVPQLGLADAQRPW